MKKFEVWGTLEKLTLLWNESWLSLIPGSCTGTYHKFMFFLVHSALCLFLWHFKISHMHAFQRNLDNFRYDTDVTQILNPHLCLQNHKTNLFFTTSNLLVKYSWFFWKFSRSLGGSIISRSKSQPNQVHHWILREQISRWMHWLGQGLICLIMDPPNV